jgi:formylglycine-generating enzyme required for sulfatase activity
VIICVGKNNPHNFQQARFWSADQSALPHWAQVESLLANSRTYRLGLLTWINLRARFLAGGLFSEHLVMNSEFLARWLRQDCDEMIDLVQANGGVPMLLSYYTPFGLTNRTLKEAADARGVSFVDVTSFGVPPWRIPEYIAPDFHPNARGYAAIADRVFDAIVGRGILPDADAKHATRPPDPNPIPTSGPERPGILEWVAVPAGSFRMGCSPGDPECSPDERPAHDVRVESFELTRTEVTQSQYEKAVGGNPSDFRGCPNCPVDRASFDEATAFCAAVGGRLASEAEWEYAARAGAATRFSCGDDARCLADYGWFDANSGWRPHPVGGKRPNAFGVFDMSGNVAEWVQDRYHREYAHAPADGRPWLDPDDRYRFRVIRGGMWTDEPRRLRVSARPWDLPYDRIDYGLGIRCARDASRGARP